MRVVILTTDNREQWRKYELPEPVFGTAPEALLQGMAMLPAEAEVHVISCVRQKVRDLERLAANVFFHSLLVPKIGWMTTGYQGCIRAVRRKLRELRPDIVHGQGTERDCSVTAMYSGFPNVLTIHGNMRLIKKLTKPPFASYNWLNAYVEGFTIPRSDGVICITHYTENAVNHLARRTWVLPNAVDARFFEIERQPTSPPVALVVGHVCARKNQNDFIRALDPLAAARKFTVCFFGTAPPGDPYADEFRELLATRPWCEHLGWAERDALRERFAHAAMLALPSLEDNCPMVVLEAMAAGVPVAAANVGGVPDLVEDGVTGWLCDPYSMESMREIVARMLDAPANAKQMAVAAKERARVRFHPRIIARKHLEIYCEVLSTRS